VSGSFLDLPSFVAHLETTGRLRRVAAEVDKDTELACIARWAMEGHRDEHAYAILFEQVRGQQRPVVVGLYSTLAMYAGAIGATPDAVLEQWATALERPITPRTVEAGPVQQHTVTGDAVDLMTLPAPTWTPGRDAGPYLSAANVITKDPETGVQNLASYRVQLHGRRRLGLFFGSRLQHGARHLAKWKARGEPMPVALMVGGPPAVNFAAAAKTAYGVDELTIAGGLAGAPIDVVRGRTVELLVPARAECIIEGFVDPDVQQMEGPFGEALGYMNNAAPAHVIEVTAMTQRNGAMHHGYVQQLPPSDGHLVWEFGVLGPLWYYLTRKLRMTGLRDLAILRGSAGVSSLVVQLERAVDQDAARAGRALAKLSFGQKFIYLVDDDIDIRDPETVNWAISARVDPARDITLIDDTQAFQYDASVLARAARDGAPLGEPPYRSSIAIVDATVKCAVPEVALPAPTALAAALARWSEFGLPPITPRERLRRLSDRSDSERTPRT
jgi:UbiD family decarboxylase